MRLLLAEDDQRLLKSLVYIFEKNKYSVDTADNGEDALALALSGQYDGLVLDIMMPKLDGVEVLRRLRNAKRTVPVMLLTARTEVYQRVEGLDAGADDYLLKPFSTAELLARVRAMLRRRDNYTPDLMEFGGVVLNCSSRQLSFSDNSQSLSGREYQIIEIFFRRPEAYVTTEELIERIWGWDEGVDTAVVWVHISNIRKKLAALQAPIELRFSRGSGYTLKTAP